MLYTIEFKEIHKKKGKKIRERKTARLARRPVQVSCLPPSLSPAAQSKTLLPAQPAAAFRIMAAAAAAAGAASAAVAANQDPMNALRAAALLAPRRTGPPPPRPSSPRPSAPAAAAFAARPLQLPPRPPVPRGPARAPRPGRSSWRRPSPGTPGSPPSRCYRPMTPPVRTPPPMGGRLAWILTPAVPSPSSRRTAPLRFGHPPCLDELACVLH